MSSHNFQHSVNMLIICVIIAIIVSAIKYCRRRNNKIKYLLLRDGIIIPKRATPGSIGYDVFCPCETTIPPHSTVKIRLGFCIQVPSGYFIEMHARSSLSMKNTTIGAGIIDPDYTGEISLLFANLNDHPISFKAGECIGQFMIRKSTLIDEFKVVDKFPNTIRGNNGFGSTNVKM